jgi:hypothetical protein
MTRSAPLRSLLVAPAALLAAACADGDSPRPITQTQEATIAPGSFKVGATSAERFGGGAEGPHGTSSGRSAPRELVYEVPQGWKELPPRQFREVNLQPAGHPDAECYVSALPGAAGGIAENVNRWRKQFGQPPLDQAAIAALPRQELYGIDATLVEVEGDYAAAGPGGQAAAPRSGFALVGLLAFLGDQLVTVKMVGPKDLLRAERPRFDGFVKSLRGVTAGGATGRGGAPEVDPHAATAGPSPAHSLPPAGGFVAMGISVQAPAGWTRDADRPTRVATLKPPGAKQSECAIIVLPGDAGGVPANLQRWRGQMGLSQLSLKEIESLPKVAMLGTEGVVVDWRGSFSDTMTARTIEQARFLAAIATLQGRTIFVKLTGPESEIDDQVRDAFLELCSSLKE